MPRVAMLLVYAITLALTFVSRVTLPRGISFAIPAGWQVTTARINGVRDPVTVFTATSFRLRHRQPAPGLCSRTLQDQWRVDGAYVQLTEERGGVLRRSSKPRHSGRKSRATWWTEANSVGATLLSQRAEAPCPAAREGVPESHGARSRRVPRFGPASARPRRWSSAADARRASGSR